MAKQIIVKGMRAAYKIHKYIKNDFLMAEDMSNAEYGRICLSVIVFTPCLIIMSWLIFGGLQALTGLR